MDRIDAEAIHEAGQEAVIVTLQQQCERIKKLEKRISSLRKNSTNSSKPPSSDDPKIKKENPEKVRWSTRPQRQEA
jgi:tetrahydromethanopterin S-methyltransferase subunit B